MQAHHSSIRSTLVPIHGTQVYERVAWTTSMLRPTTIHGTLAYGQASWTTSTLQSDHTHTWDLSLWFYNITTSIEGKASRRGMEGGILPRSVIGAYGPIKVHNRINMVAI